MSARKGRSGFPAFEVALCVVIAGCVLGVLIERVDTVLEQSEKVAVETTIVNLRSALRLEKARRISAGLSMHDLPEQNPLNYVELPSVGSSGDNLSNLSKSLKMPDWRYNEDTKTVVYQPYRQRHLKMLQTGADKLLMWHLVSHAADGRDTELELASPYVWF